MMPVGQSGMPVTPCSCNPARAVSLRCPATAEGRLRPPLLLRVSAIVLLAASTGGVLPAHGRSDSSADAESAVSAVRFSARSDEGLRAAVQRCGGIEADSARLDCFDAVAIAVADFVATGAAADDPQQSQRSLPSVDSSGAGGGSPADEHGFGMESMPNRAARVLTGPDSIRATAVAVQRRPRGEHLFELSNGQIWVETEPGRGRYPVGAEVQIERTTMGGYMLSTDQGRATRVRRVE